MPTEAERERALEAIRSLIPEGAKLIRQRDSDMYWAANSQGHVGANPLSAAIYLPGSRADEFPEHDKPHEWYTPAVTISPIEAVRGWIEPGSLVEAMAMEIVRLRGEVSIINSEKISDLARKADGEASRHPNEARRSYCEGQSSMARAIHMLAFGRDIGSQEIAEVGVENIQTRLGMLKRYAFLSGYPTRYDDEEAELHALRDAFVGAEDDPGWEIVPRDPRFGARP